MSVGSVIFHKKSSTGKPLCGEDQLGYISDNPQQVTCRACQILIVNPKILESTIIEDIVKLSKSLNKKDWSNPSLLEAIVFLKDNYNITRTPNVGSTITLGGKNLTISEVKPGISGGMPTVYIKYEERPDVTFNWRYTFELLLKEKN